MYATLPTPVLSLGLQGGVHALVRKVLFVTWWPGTWTSGCSRSTVPFPAVMLACRCGVEWHGDRRTTADVWGAWADFRCRAVCDVHTYDEAAAQGVWGRPLGWAEGQAVVSVSCPHDSVPYTSGAFDLERRGLSVGKSFLGACLSGLCVWGSTKADWVCGSRVHEHNASLVFLHTTAPGRWGPRWPLAVVDAPCESYPSGIIEDGIPYGKCCE